MQDKVLELFSGIQVNREHGFIKPHKYLVLLLALRELRENKTSALAWNESSSKIERLIEQFNNKKNVNAKNPFFRLSSDAIWEVTPKFDAEAKFSDLQRENPVGKLSSEVEIQLLQNPELFARVIRLILDTAFTDSIYEDVLVAVGFDPHEILYANPFTVLDIAKRRRDPQWPRKILQAWENQCAFCGYDGKIDNTPVGIDAAHIRWFNQEGPDELDNGLALCTLHHRLLDRGVLGFRDPETLTVSASFAAVSESGKRVYDLHDSKLEPRIGTELPAIEYVEWHTENIFRGETL
jgi:putative restriction endonuclease